MDPEPSDLLALGYSSTRIFFPSAININTFQAYLFNRKEGKLNKTVEEVYDEDAGS